MKMTKVTSITLFAIVINITSYACQNPTGSIDPDTKLPPLTVARILEIEASYKSESVLVHCDKLLLIDLEPASGYSFGGEELPICVRQKLLYQSFPIFHPYVIATNAKLDTPKP